MVSARKEHSAPVSSFKVTDEMFARSIARMKAMTKDERIQSLKDAGIITAKGNYTKPYRMLGQSQTRAPRAAIN